MESYTACEGAAAWRESGIVRVCAWLLVVTATPVEDDENGGAGREDEEVAYEAAELDAPAAADSEAVVPEGALGPNLLLLLLPLAGAAAGIPTAATAAADDDDEEEEDAAAAAAASGCAAARVRSFRLSRAVNSW